MNPGLVVKLRPTGPWRIGSDSGARNRVDAIYHSDTLYSAVASAMARLGSLEEWLDVTARPAAAGVPAVCFSSCFPFVDDSLLIVPPRTAWPPVGPAMSARVRWKSARFVPLGVVQAVLAGQKLNEDRWAIDGPSECLAPVGTPGPFRVSLRWNAAVDRLTGATERHSVACAEFRAGAGLWTVVSFADEAARDHWQDRVKTAFRLLADSGFGGERSRGWGRSDTPEFIEGMLPELILSVSQEDRGQEDRGQGSGARGQGPGAGGQGVEPAPVPESVIPSEPSTEQPMEGPQPEPAAEESPTVEHPITEPEPTEGEASVEAHPELAPLAAAPESEPVPEPESQASEQPTQESAPEASKPELPSPEESQSTEKPADEPEPESPAPGPRPPAPEEAPGPRPLAPEQPPAPEKAPEHPGKPHWLLSLFVPAAEDAVDWSRGNYALITRSGRIESSAGSGELKKQVQMVAEGSVLFAAPAPRGSAPDVAPDGFAHPVYRAGFAVAIPLPEAH